MLRSTYLGVYPILLTIALCSSAASAFGVDAHKIVTQITENHLTETTKKAITQLTGGADLINIVLWPDRIRYTPGYQKSAQWHYINIADDQRLDDLKHGTDGDILTAMEHFHGQLIGNEITKKEKIESLRFFMHFVQDIHQPLHVGLQIDRGGNSVAVKWFNTAKTKTLHWVWDTGMVKTKNLSTDQYVRLLDQISPRKIREWQSSSFLDWAAESKSLRQQVYDFSPEKQTPTTLIGQSYVDRNITLLEERLVMAGIRLAGKLNKIFDPNH